MSDPTRSDPPSGAGSAGGSAKPGRRTLLALAAAAAAGGVGVIAKTVWSRNRGGARRAAASPELAVRGLPVAIPFHGELAEVVPVEQTRKLLTTLLPCWIQAVKVGNLLHAYRLWGPQARFPTEVFTRPFDTPLFSGQDMERTFLDSKGFEKTFPLDLPLLMSYPDGIVVRTGYTAIQGGHMGALVHPDNVLRTFAELGYSSEIPVVAMKGDVRAVDGKLSVGDLVQGTIGDIVRGSVAYFDPEQELEWTVEALARYLAPQSTWTNRFGHGYSLDELAERLVETPLGVGSCLGLHVPYALVCLYRIDQEHRILSDSAREKVEEHFRSRSRGLELKQNSDGMFFQDNDPLWSGKQDPHEDRSKWLSTNELTVLSHHLDWIALAPEGLRPKRETVQRAVEAMLRGLEPWTMYVRSADYAPLSHAGSSLCGLLGRSATDVVFQGREGNGGKRGVQ